MFHKVWKLERFETAKVKFKVIQGHRQSCHSIRHIRFFISVPLLTIPVLASLTRYYHAFSKIDSNISVSGSIYVACTSTPVCQSAPKFELTPLEFRRDLWLQ